MGRLEFTRRYRIKFDGVLNQQESQRFFTALSYFVKIRGGNIESINDSFLGRGSMQGFTFKHGYDSIFYDEFRRSVNSDQIDTIFEIGINTKEILTDQWRYGLFSLVYDYVVVTKTLDIFSEYYTDTLSDIRSKIDYSYDFEYEDPQYCFQIDPWKIKLTPCVCGNRNKIERNLGTNFSEQPEIVNPDVQSYFNLDLYKSKYYWGRLDSKNYWGGLDSTTYYLLKYCPCCGGELLSDGDEQNFQRYAEYKNKLNYRETIFKEFDELRRTYQFATSGICGRFNKKIYELGDLTSEFYHHDMPHDPRIKNMYLQNDPSRPYVVIFSNYALGGEYMPVVNIAKKIKWREGFAPPIANLTNRPSNHR
jgi:hypothetical protein